MLKKLTKTQKAGIGSILVAVGGVISLFGVPAPVGVLISAIGSIFGAN